MEYIVLVLISKVDPLQQTCSRIVILECFKSRQTLCSPHTSGLVMCQCSLFVGNL